MEYADFIKHIKTECSQKSVELIISDKNRVFYESIECNGFFAEKTSISISEEHIVNKKEVPKRRSKKERSVLAFSTGNKTKEEVISLVAHEYSHMCQYLEGSKYWPKNDELATLDDWLYNKKSTVTKQKLYHAWKKSVEVEADCEIRAVKLIKKMKLNVDLDLYIKKANAYLFFYSWLKKNKKWYKKAPYEIKEIIDLMPNKFLKIEDYTNSKLMTKSLEDKFNLCY